MTYQPAAARYLQMPELRLLGVRPEEQKFLTPKLISSMTFTAGAPGTPAIGSINFATTDDQFVIQLVLGHEDALEGWVRLFDGV